jgi:hypothetical protein
MPKNRFSGFLTFRLMIAPVVIQALFWIGLVAVLTVGVVYLVTSMTLYGIAILALGPFVWRLTCEYSILFFRMHTSLEEVARNTRGLSVPTDSRADATSGGRRVGEPHHVATEYGLLISEVSIGGHYQARDGRIFKVVQFTNDGIRVEFDQGKTETIRPVDPAAAEGLWSFDIRRARNS